MVQPLRKMIRGKRADCSPLVQIHRLRRWALHVIGWRAEEGARAIQKHEWPRLVNSDFPKEYKKSESLVFATTLLCDLEGWVAG